MLKVGLLLKQGRTSHLHCLIKQSPLLLEGTGETASSFEGDVLSFKIYYQAKKMKKNIVISPSRVLLLLLRDSKQEEV